MKRALLFFSLACMSQQCITAQTTRLSDNTDLKSGISLNGNAIFIQRNGTNVDSIWESDGTVNGTRKALVNVAYLDTSNSLLVFNNKLFFTGITAATGAELWLTDGTDAGTSLLKDINPTGDAIPLNFISFNNKIYFTADDGTHGKELFVTDGTSAGTTLLKDINAGSAGAFTSGDFFRAIGSNLFFTANDGTHGTELWKTDGTTTSLVKDITSGSTGTVFTGNAVNLGNKLLFSVTNGFNLQLWISDGSSAGTILLKDFGNFSSFYAGPFLSFNSKVYFNGTATDTGNELWVTDGTVGGTTLLADINPGPSPSSPELFFSVVINSKFYFTATTNTSGAELWESDGTAAGTKLLKDINPGATGSTPVFLVDFRNASGDFNHPSLYNGQLFFTADDGTHGTELWITDGTSANTKLVKDINPGTAASSINFGYFYTAQGLFFGADDGTSGNEPWKSDGTAIGTARIADLNPGVNSSNPNFIAVNNSILYLSADDGNNTNGLTDLFRLNSAVTLPVTLLNFTAIALPNSVQLNWTTSSELNSSHFAVERSTDGIHFNAIAKVNAAGNSSVEKKYLYNDGEALHLNASSLFYRIQMVDKDGTAKPSGILNVRLKEQSFGVTVLPNPVQQQLSVLFNAAGAKKIGLNVTDANGKLLYRQQLPTGQAAYQQNINVAGFAKGIYFIQLVTDKQVRTLKFVKES